MWTLTIEVEDELYEAVAGMATQARKTTEELGAEWFALAVERLLNDSLLKLAGSITSEVPDWADRHDEYLGRALYEEMTGARSHAEQA